MTATVDTGMRLSAAEMRHTEYTSPKELADVLGVSLATVYRYLERGLYPGAFRYTDKANWHIPIRYLSDPMPVRSA
ncbi:helix-turn-helix domain-containing protein [Gordonia paraffinivorans]|uniref:helix-turn-helix domain-containing protein n=1 Tax=Gordonia paraffinivorans TaxID=175628 RepID=UPI001E3624A4|nr:helix-turn-helix domain-containing protein [Gordonia paraffinivorans]MCD2143725.1 helix-turn-helix domain-containing protein [Gordonia paraffinivorans]